MIRRIVLENYMSHAHTVIEPAAEGLTVLVGPNNCGKSAVVSALLTVCGENDGDFMVRHGEKHARVTIETAEGDTIVWQRKGKSPSYVINGREVHRVGRGNLPDDLQTLLKLPVIEFGEGAGRNRFLVHFGTQKEPIFLINSEADVAKFFASSAESERLLSMQRRHKDKTRKAKTERGLIEPDLERIARELDGLSPLDAIEPEVEAIEAEHRALAEQRATVDGLQQHIRRLELASAAVSRQESRVAALAGLNAEPPATQDDRTLAKLCERISVLNRDIAIAQRRIDSTDNLPDPPTPVDVKPIIDLGKSLATSLAKVARYENAVAVLATLAEVPALVDPAPMAQAVERMDKANARVAECMRVEKKVSNDLAVVRDEIVAWVTANPLCPVCGGQVERERVLDAGGAHAG